MAMLEKRNVNVANFRKILLEIIEENTNVQIVMKCNDLHQISKKGGCKSYCDNKMVYDDNGNTYMYMCKGVMMRTTIRFCVAKEDNEFGVDATILQVVFNGEVVYNKERDFDNSEKCSPKTYLLYYSE